MNRAAAMAAAPQPSYWSLLGKAFLGVTVSPVLPSRQASGSVLSAFAVCQLGFTMGVALPRRCASRTYFVSYTQGSGTAGS